MGRLDNKVAIITGGASGIGECMVDLFSKEGAIVIAADINEEALARASQKENVYGMKLNVASDNDWEALAKEVNDRFGKIDVLVNNAGISSEKPFQEIDLDDWQKMLSINGFGPFSGMKHIAPYMAAQGKGSIINISSYTAQIGQGFNHYSASKGAVRAISKAAATTFGTKGVRVNALFPGIIETPMTQSLNSSKELLGRLIQMTPLQRLGQPTDIAKAALFLASDDSSYITGAELVIDGGFSAQ
ncbi:SDR family oxidoreductase [Psychrobacillus psychrodurans]|jgi:NAD(P)-dependent dehydrogenase (short-subunit alcohol dehydrogenase family)|uniref:SDR family NAD(P)-dependent oxidoreductase n=1 Tax=Psychrobacillus TaxID=1221880 RepID=UPI0008E6D60C|nr:SDR family oxidoreductase [Psychrobacillus psychrodurans]MCK1997858.1 SDR family oxidoreductase [Psychrobacillus psychrodurans]MCZ8541041.1 SDR family oxidoreductase [Psychrobacillus psychrodurans]SFM83273.1 NAD(P)-dependent dehydrogenase, short-chain alcohol dehydrogenase family [Psychrobacillus psychrodurans]